MKDSAIRYANVFEFRFGMITRHIERPVIVQDVVAWRVSRHNERCDPSGVARLTGRPCEYQIGVSSRDLTVPSFASIDDPVRAVPNRRGFEPGRVATMSRLRQAERKMLLSCDNSLDIGL